MCCSAAYKVLWSEHCRWNPLVFGLTLFYVDYVANKQFKNNIDHCLTFTQPSKLLSLSRTTKTLELIVQDGFKGEGPITSRLALGCLWYVPYLRNQKPITDKFGSLIVLGVVR